MSVTTLGFEEEPRVQLMSLITCPTCGGQTEETMPTDACRYVYTCGRCGATLRPQPGACCVFCSYGSVACPPVQSARNDHARKL